MALTIAVLRPLLKARLLLRTRATTSFVDIPIAGVAEQRSVETLTSPCASRGRLGDEAIAACCFDSRRGGRAPGRAHLAGRDSATLAACDGACGRRLRGGCDRAGSAALRLLAGRDRIRPSD